jgi:glutathione S-transferase
MIASKLPLLIGQFDSPFVRRVAVAMSVYELPFERRAWSVFRDAEKIAAYNPLRRVPTLVLPTGEVLVESTAILDALDDQVDDARVLLPRRGSQRRMGLRVAAFACGLADKGVALVYENVAREPGSQSSSWVERCKRQVEGALLMLESERAAVSTRWWLGESLSHADIAVGVVVHFLYQGVPAVLDQLALPALREHEAKCHELSAFRDHDEPLHFPKA